ncbi:hypothetical protein EG68_00451 [Paragonimus skrjabini miyazakii]|uniref:Uncharacterized protein n=1 Tax=Paragonimus skrjabini miyazakii TaxID=59628 RepID=A0A8S9ZCD6_9TREM|nr:hypothetical protein EG68_00451 [Paragonimus skrjabini miyazakii]
MSRADKTVPGKSKEDDDSETETEETEEDEQTDSEEEEEEDTEDDEEDSEKTSITNKLSGSNIPPENEDAKLNKAQTTQEPANRVLKAEAASEQGETASSNSQKLTLQTGELKEYLEKTVNELVTPIRQAIADVLVWKQEITVELKTERTKWEQAVTKCNELQAEVKLAACGKVSGASEQDEQISRMLLCLQRIQDEHSTTLSQLITFKQEIEERWKMMCEVEKNTAPHVTASTSNLQVEKDDPVGRSAMSAEPKPELPLKEPTNLLEGLDKNSLQLLHTKMSQAKQLNYTDLIRQIRS